MPLATSTPAKIRGRGVTKREVRVERERWFPKTKKGQGLREESQNINNRSKSK